MSVKPSYQVLARTTRPLKFSQFIGQDSLVQTFLNAIRSNRLAHAYILTGIRGTGKTTTARLIARALNCEFTDVNHPHFSPEPCGICSQCVAILNDSHLDVIEIDAASRTGVEDIRTILEGVTYRPVQGRFKVYIIDEVHMLSKNAFNAFLVTLEAPPSHVTFIFATTEIKKVPATILSRCQRFGLKRVSIEALIGHYKSILNQENIQAEERALTLIAEAADGSVRDGLSILEQAILRTYAPGQKNIPLTSAIIEDMLGLINPQQNLKLFMHLIQGEILPALRFAKDLFEAGADPIHIIQDQLNLIHDLMIKNVADNSKIPDHQSIEIGLKGGKFDLGVPIDLSALHLMWQILLKGLDELKTTNFQFKNLEVILIRLTHVCQLYSTSADIPASLPLSLNLGTPSESKVAPNFQAPIKNLDISFQGPSSSVENSSIPLESVDNPFQEPEKPILSKNNDLPLVSSVPQEIPPSIPDFLTLVKILDSKKEPFLAEYLRHSVRLVQFDPAGKIVLNQIHETPENFPLKLKNYLKKLTTQVWQVDLSAEKGQPSLGEQQAHKKTEEKESVLNHPDVQKIKEQFPDAHIIHS